jgi:hypothetical protein
MSIDQKSALFAALADWVKTLILSPDPPPEQLRVAAEVSILTMMSLLSERLPSESRFELRKVLTPIVQKAVSSGSVRAFAG